jgi:N6-adenosine-specific RNA methylase IME4
MAPNHWRLSRYGTLDLAAIAALPVAALAAKPAHRYLRVPNALLAEGFAVIQAWGLAYKSNIVWHMIRKDDGQTAGASASTSVMSANDFCLTTSVWCARIKRAQALAGRTQVNFMATQKQGHSRMSDEQYRII